MDVRYTEYLVLWLDMWNNLLQVGVFVSFALILTRVERDMVKELRDSGIDHLLSRKMGVRDIP
jgi:hypothetical protein